MRDISELQLLAKHSSALSCHLYLLHLGNSLYVEVNVGNQSLGNVSTNRQLIAAGVGFSLIHTMKNTFWFWTFCWSQTYYGAMQSLQVAVKYSACTWQLTNINSSVGIWNKLLAEGLSYCSIPTAESARRHRLPDRLAAALSFLETVRNCLN